MGGGCEAELHLPLLIKDGCVERAIHSAGGPEGIQCMEGLWSR
jgi:hypothetical protein